jgi:hypothetical protein
MPPPRLLDRPADRMNMDIAGKAENEDGHRTSTPCFEYGSSLGIPADRRNKSAGRR